jgi:hypothetical protein
MRAFTALHEIDKKLICKIVGFTNDEYESFVKPVN